MKPVDHLITMAEKYRVATGQDANTMQMTPAIRDRISPDLIRRDTESLPPVLRAMSKRERKRANRRKRAARIRKGRR